MYNAKITTQPYKSWKSLTIYVDNKNMVNELMIALMDAGFIVNYEPTEDEVIYSKLLSNYKIFKLVID